jgi:ferredoxin-NADP reductase
MTSQLLVRSMTVESDGVLSLELVDPDGHELPAWEPGAHLDLKLAEGMSRQYSLSGDPADRRRYRVGVLREVAGRGGSAYVHDVLRPGQVVGYTGPRNHFRLEPAGRYIFIAGGIGITPILPMVARVHAEGRPWTLLYGGRTAASMAFTDELAAYGDRVTLHPQDEHGLLDLDGMLGSSRIDTLVYCCGPEPLLRAVEERTTLGNGWPADALHLERFAAPEQPAREPGGEHEVEVVLAESGITLRVGPDTSILQAILDAGIDHDHDCTEGICGTCETKVIEGEVDHRDYVLTQREKDAGDCMMVCVSRACGKRLVLGL